MYSPRGSWDPRFGRCAVHFSLRRFGLAFIHVFGMLAFMAVALETKRDLDKCLFTFFPPFQKSSPSAFSPNPLNKETWAQARPKIALRGKKKNVIPKCSSDAAFKGQMKKMGPKWPFSALNTFQGENGNF